jgi:hypothetical protein
LAKAARQMPKKQRLQKTKRKVDCRWLVCWHEVLKKLITDG